VYLHDSMKEIQLDCDQPLSTHGTFRPPGAHAAGGRAVDQIYSR